MTPTGYCFSSDVQAITGLSKDDIKNVIKRKFIPTSIVPASTGGSPRPFSVRSATALLAARELNLRGFGPDTVRDLLHRHIGDLTAAGALWLVVQPNGGADLYMEGEASDGATLDGLVDLWRNPSSLVLLNVRAIRQKVKAMMARAAARAGDEPTPTTFEWAGERTIAAA